MLLLLKTCMGGDDFPYLRSQRVVVPLPRELGLDEALRGEGLASLNCKMLR